MERVLADNLRALMRHSATLPEDKRLDTQDKVAKATGNAINQRTVSRILRAEHKVRIDTIAALAEAFDVAPYQLLIPGLNPRNPQVLRALSPAEERLYSALEEARKAGTQ